MMSIHPSKPLLFKQTAGYYKPDFPIHSREQIFLQKVKRVIQDNLGNDQFGVTKLAEKVFLSVSQLNRRLKALINCSAGQLIRKTRMKHASNLLANNIATIGEIALKVGYKNQAHFCRSFKQQFGCPPSIYLKCHYQWKEVDAQKW